MTTDSTLRPGIFGAVHEAFAASDGPLTTPEIYAKVRQRVGLSEAEFDERVPIGKKGRLHSLKQRTARWTIQTMKSRGLVDKVPGRRGVWQLTEIGKHKLHRIQRGEVMVAFSTRLGVALWADCRDALRGLAEPIHLLVSSPPYALAKPRAYGGPPQAEYVDWLCEAMEVVVKHLAPGGSIMLNLGNDQYEPNSPARTVLTERLVLALHDRLGLRRMDTLIWHNPTRAPGPIQWASKHRYQLNQTYEPILWMTNDPHRVRSNNQRILQPHSERHKALIERGGEYRAARHSDGAYGRRAGSFGRPTEGRIQRNVLEVSHSCGSQRRYKERARALGLPVHGAPMPLALARMLIEFASEPGDLVADFFGGSLTSALAAELSGRRWISGDLHAEYLRGGAERFDNPAISPWLDQLFGLAHHGQSALPFTSVTA